MRLGSGGGERTGLGGVGLGTCALVRCVTEIGFDVRTRDLGVDCRQTALTCGAVRRGGPEYLLEVSQQGIGGLTNIGHLCQQSAQRFEEKKSTEDA